jgi:hypothetical protein
MVRGVPIAVTAVPVTNQCAEMDRTARGRGIRAPMAVHAAVYAFVSNAFMGLPWPKKIAGMRACMEKPVLQLKYFSFTRAGAVQRG